MESQYSQTIGSNLCILRGPDALRDGQRRGIDLCNLWQGCFIDEEQADRLMILIGRGEDGKRIILNCQGNHLILQMCKQLVNTSHRRLASIECKERCRIHYRG